MKRGAYIDNRGICWDTNTTDYEGWIGKRSKWLGEWRNRYFLLIGARLFYAKDETTTPHGLIDLLDCISIKAVNNNVEKGYMIEIKLKAKSFHILVQTIEEQNQWLDAINLSLQKNSAMYLLDTTENNN